MTPGRGGRWLLSAGLLLAGLAGCDGAGLVGNRLSGTWCVPASTSSPEALILSLSGNGTGLMALVPGTRPSVPLDWREDRERLLLLQPGSQEIAFTVPIVAGAQGEPQLLIPGLGSLFNLHLHRCGAGGNATAGPAMPPIGTAQPALNGDSAVTLAVVLGGALLLLLVGGITVVMVLQARDDE